jgi:FkbM family methyltransferase
LSGNEPVNREKSYIMNELLKKTADVVRSAEIDVSFTLIEVGALSVGATEPFYELLDYFPSSRIIAFEIDEQVCTKMNSESREGVEYFPFALGSHNREVPLYVTNHPMCTSLYKPNEKLISLYHNFEVAYLKSIEKVRTTQLDKFLKDQNIDTVDFIKIDVQGAELDIFKGGQKALNDVLKIVCEVEFVPHYENQPLFGDVCNFLAKKDLMFNKFLGLAGRSLKPIVMNNDMNFPSQHIWSDAIYIKHVQKIPQLNDSDLIKLALLAATYNSADLVHYCLSFYDKNNPHATISNTWKETILT